MNEYFANVATRTIEIGNFTEDTNDFLPSQHPPCFDFKPISQKNIADAINRLSSSKASSHDGITAYMIKCAKVELLPILDYPFNRSITLKTFPYLWKDAIFTPLYKCGNSTEVGKCIHDQCYIYLTAHNPLTPSQSGFRKADSTTTCLIDFLDNVYQGVDGGGCL